MVGSVALVMGLYVAQGLWMVVWPVGLLYGCQPLYQFPALAYARTPPWARTEEMEICSPLTNCLYIYFRWSDAEHLLDKSQNNLSNAVRISIQQYNVMRLSAKTTMARRRPCHQRWAITVGEIRPLNGTVDRAHSAILRCGEEARTYLWTRPYDRPRWDEKLACPRRGDQVCLLTIPYAVGCSHSVEIIVWIYPG